jgi:hypothetical protein
MNGRILKCNNPIDILYSFKKMNSLLWTGKLSLPAKAVLLDHIPPVKLTFLYFSIDQEINSDEGWLIFTGERWSVSPVFANSDLKKKVFRM